MKLLLTKFRQIPRNAIIAVLVLLSFTMTSGTFAYWTNYVDASSDINLNSFSIGSALNQAIELNHDYDEDGYTVNAKTIMPGEKNANDYAEIQIDVLWDDESELLWGSITEGNVEITYELVLTKSGTLLTEKQYNKVIEYIHINADSLNPSTINANEEETFIYRVTVDRPSKRGHRTLLKKVDIEVIFTVTVNDGSN